jgi:hypothetical protein
VFNARSMYVMMYFIMSNIFGSVRREIFIVFHSVWSSEYLPHPHHKRRYYTRINLCQLFLIRHALRSLFKVPDIWSVTRGGSVKAIVDNILSRPINLQLIIIRFIPSDRITRIDDFSVAM